MGWSGSRASVTTKPHGAVWSKFSTGNGSGPGAETSSSSGKIKLPSSSSSSSELRSELLSHSIDIAFNRPEEFESSSSSFNPSKVRLEWLLAEMEGERRRWEVWVWVCVKVEKYEWWQVFVEFSLKPNGWSAGLLTALIVKMETLWTGWSLLGSRVGFHQYAQNRSSFITKLGNKKSEINLCDEMHINLRRKARKVNIVRKQSRTNPQQRGIMSYHSLGRQAHVNKIVRNNISLKRYVRGIESHLLNAVQINRLLHTMRPMRIKISRSGE